MPRLEQMLHGYADGHRLLAASTELSRADKHLMLTLSDMSGRSMVSGFETYLTGYPVDAFYVLARTWYAPEMERPGCVWTHSLLIRREELPTIDDLHGLEQYFIRPSHQGSWAEYERAIDDSSRQLASPPAQTIRHSLNARAIARLLDSLYSNLRPVFLLASSPNEFEATALSIWSQQWPSLRERFAFCTGAIASRFLNGKPFDLQAIPTASLREIRRDSPNGDFIDLRREQKGAAELTAPWLIEAVRDTETPIGGLRPFLSDISNHIHGGRELFIPLVELYLARGPERTATLEFPCFLDQILCRAPRREDLSHLKASLLQPAAPLLRLFEPPPTECIVLETLAHVEAPDAFDIDVLHLEERSKELWTSNPGEARQLLSSLTTRDHNVIGETILRSLIESLGIDDAIALSGSIPGLLQATLRTNPLLAASQQLWTGPVYRQRELFDVVASSDKLDDVIKNEIAIAMVQAGSDAVAEKVVRDFGPSVLRSVLENTAATSSPSPEHIPAGWRREVAHHAETVMTWLTTQARQSPEALVLASHFLDPHARSVRDHGIESWLAAQHERIIAPLSPDTRRHFLAFTLALGLDNAGERSHELVAAGFEPVHDALASSRLTYEEWSWFDEQIPTLSWGRNWDKCERLRRGVIEAFVEHRWPVEWFVCCASTVRVLQQLLDSSENTKPGKKLLGRLREALQQGTVNTSPDRQEVLWRYLRFY